jgi:acylphosphatase
MSIRLRIHGRVQGVAYRAWLVDQARTYGVNGWVRNRRDGTVEALLDGKPAGVEAVSRLCETGPSAARVDRIERTSTEETGPSGFVQWPSV